MLVACGDGGDDSADPRSPETASGEFAGTIRLGAALSETGNYAVEGKDSRQGYDTWLRWVNEIYGGIRVSDQRYRAEIVYYDDESDADTAGILTQRLIDDDRVDFLLGPYSSGLTTGTSAIAEANNVLMVEGNGTSDTMFDRGFQNLFLVATIASDYTRSGIEALAARGARTAVIAYEDTSFASAVALESLQAVSRGSGPLQFPRTVATASGMERGPAIAANRAPAAAANDSASAASPAGAITHNSSRRRAAATGSPPAVARQSDSSTATRRRAVQRSSWARAASSAAARSVVP